MTELRKAWIRLSFAYGIPVPILQEIIGIRHFRELMEYMAIDPQGERRADLRAGIIAATLANVNRGKGTKAYQPKDFMPQFEGDMDRTKRANPNQVRAQLNALAAIMKASGGKVIDNRKRLAEANPNG